MKKPKQDFSWTTFIDVFNHKLMVFLGVVLLVFATVVYYTVFHFTNYDETHCLDEAMTNRRRIHRIGCVFFVLKIIY